MSVQIGRAWAGKARKAKALTKCSLPTLHVQSGGPIFNHCYWTKFFKRAHNAHPRKYPSRGGGCIKEAGLWNFCRGASSYASPHPSPGECLMAGGAYNSDFGCSFLAYNWKLPAHGSAFLLAIVWGVFAYNGSFFVCFAVGASLFFLFQREPFCLQWERGLSTSTERKQEIGCSGPGADGLCGWISPGGQGEAPR